MDALFSMNVFFADQPSGWIWGHRGGDWKVWVSGGILFLLVCFWIYDGIKNRNNKYWRDRARDDHPSELPTRRWLYDSFLFQLWRDAPPEITTWGKIWRTVLFLGFLVIVVWAVMFGKPTGNMTTVGWIFSAVLLLIVCGWIFDVVKTRAGGGGDSSCGSSCGG